MKVKATKDLFYRGEKYKAGDVFVVTDIYFKTMNKRAVIAADEPESSEPEEAPEGQPQDAPEAKEEAPEEQPKKTRRKSKTKMD